MQFGWDVCALFSSCFLIWGLSSFLIYEVIVFIKFGKFIFSIIFLLSIPSASYFSLIPITHVVVHLKVTTAHWWYRIYSLFPQFCGSLCFILGRLCCYVFSFTSIFFWSISSEVNAKCVFFIPDRVFTSRNSIIFIFNFFS